MSTTPDENPVIEVTEFKITHRDEEAHLVRDKRSNDWVVHGPSMVSRKVPSIEAGHHFAVAVIEAAVDCTEARAAAQLAYEAAVRQAEIEHGAVGL